MAGVTVNIGGLAKPDLCLVNRSQQGKEMMSWGVAHEDEVIGGVLVVAGGIQSHHPLQKRL